MTSTNTEVDQRRVETRARYASRQVSFYALPRRVAAALSTWVAVHCVPLGHAPGQPMWWSGVADLAVEQGGLVLDGGDHGCCPGGAGGGCDDDGGAAGPSGVVDREDSDAGRDGGG